MFAELTHHVFVNGDIIFSRILKLLEFCETGGIAYEVAEVECHCFTGATGNDFFHQAVQRIEFDFRTVP